MSVVIKINGMSCKNCVKHVTEILSKQKGVKSVSVSLENKEAVIECDDTFSVNKAKDAINDEGYEA